MTRLILLGWALAAATCAAAVYDPASLAAELRRLDAQLGAGGPDALRDLPATWDLRTPERRYIIPTAPLKEALVWDRARSPKVMEKNSEARAWLTRLAAQLEAYNTPIAAPVNAQTRLSAILSRPEFAGVRPPNQWELFRDRLIAWIAQQIRKLLEVAAQHPTGGAILFWTLLAAVIGLLGLWLFRLWTREEQIPRFPAPNADARVRAWEEWLAAARSSAATGDLRRAIHHVYWAGTTYLQSARVLPAERSRTPREYLQFLNMRRKDNLPGEQFEAPLNALTSELERFWYAGRSATPDDFTQSLTHLAALGCKLE